MTGTAEAAEAATHWDGTLIRLIAQRENHVHEMMTPMGRAALRLHRTGYQQEAAIRSELWWCTALAAAGVAVPAPLRARDGTMLVRLANGECASAIAWVAGEPLGEGGRPFNLPPDILRERHFALGRLIAEVHEATDRLTLPDDFTRPRWDRAGLVGEAPFWGRFWDHPAARPDQRTILVRARKFLDDALARFERAGADVGPIHADVLRENVLVNGDALSLIDFDDSGLGFRLYDLGTALVQNLAEPHYARVRDGLIEGYATLRPASIEHVEMFALARACASVGWTMPRLPPESPIHTRHIARAVALADRLLG